MASTEPVYERLGAKVLALPDVIAQSVGFIGPVFSSAFVIPLVVGVISASGKGGGVASPLSVLLAAVGVLALGWIVSSFAREIHAAGSLYDYVTRGARRAGRDRGGVALLRRGDRAAHRLLLLIGGYLQSTIQAEFEVNPLPSWLWTLILIVVIAGILYFGVRVSTRSQLVLALVSIVVVTIFFISVIVKLGSANSLKPFNTLVGGDGWSGIFFGMLYGVLLFVGFETAANLAEETPNPRRGDSDRGDGRGGHRHRLLPSCHLRGGGRVPLQSQGDHLRGGGAAVRARRAGPTPGGYGGTWIDRLLELVVLFDMLAVAIGCAVSASRGIFAMGRDRRVPAALRRHLQAERGAAGRGGLRGRGVDRDPADQPVLEPACSRCRAPRLPTSRCSRGGPRSGGFALVVVYLLMSVGSLRSFATSSRRVSSIDDRGDRHRDHRGRHLRLVL